MQCHLSRPFYSSILVTKFKDQLKKSQFLIFNSSKEYSCFPDTMYGMDHCHSLIHIYICIYNICYEKVSYETQTTLFQLLPQFWRLFTRKWTGMMRFASKDGPSEDKWEFP